MINWINCIPVVTILVYIPFVCISDWRSRTFPFKYYLPLILIGIPYLIGFLAESPLRNFYSFGLSVALVFILLLIALRGYIAGGDFWFAAFILLFIQYDPFTKIRQFFPMDFFLVMWVLACMLPLVGYTYNTIKKNKLPYIQMLTTFPNGFPYLIVISLAFVLTLIIQVATQ